MHKHEDLLRKEKAKLDKMTAPHELETRLRNRLQQQPKRKSFINVKWVGLVASLLILILSTYQYNALAYYGKKLFGYEELTTDTLAALNEREFTQIIDKRYTFPDGNEFVIDGVITDENQFIIYYRVVNNAGNMATIDDSLRFNSLSGLFFSHSNYAATWIVEEDKSELKGILYFDRVSPFHKKLTLNIDYDNKVHELNFNYDPKQALDTQLKKSLNYKVKLADGSIHFEKIIATPTLTLLNGTYTGFSEIAEDNIILEANGKALEIQTASNTHHFPKKSFSIGYDSLPEKIDSLQIKIDEYPVSESINQEIPLQENMGTTIVIGQYEITLEELTKENDAVHLTITTDRKIRLKDVAITTEEGLVYLDETINYIENKDGSSTRTLVFYTDKLPNELTIDGILTTKEYQIIKDIKLRTK